jgi:hypothetical protein
MGKSKSKGLLFGQGCDPDPGWADWLDLQLVDAHTGLPLKTHGPKPNHYVGYFIIAYDRVIFFRAKKNWRDYLHTKWNLSYPKIETAGTFFDQEMGRQTY